MSRLETGWPPCVIRLPGRAVKCTPLASHLKVPASRGQGGVIENEPVGGRAAEGVVTFIQPEKAHQGQPAGVTGQLGNTGSAPVLHGLLLGGRILARGGRSGHDQGARERPHEGHESGHTIALQ